MRTFITGLFAAGLLINTVCGTDLMDALGGTARRSIDRGCRVQVNPQGELTVSRTLTALAKGSSRAAVSFQLQKPVDLSDKAITFELLADTRFDSILVYANNDGVRLPVLRGDISGKEMKSGQWIPALLQFQGAEGLRYGYRGVSGDKPEKVTSLTFCIIRNAPHPAEPLALAVRNVRIIPRKELAGPQPHRRAAAPAAVVIPARNPFAALGGLAAIQGTNGEKISFDPESGVLKITARAVRNNTAASQRRVSMRLAKTLDLRNKSLTFDVKSDDLSDFCYVFLYNRGYPKAVWAYYTYADELEKQWQPVTLQRHFSTLLNWHRLWSSDGTPDQVDRIDIVYGLITPRMSGPVTLELRNFRVGDEVRYIGNSLKKPVELQPFSRMIGSGITPPAVLYPDSAAGKLAAQKIVDAVKKSCGVTLQSRPGTRADENPENNAILLGNVWNNPAFTLIYGRRLVLYDGTSPGKGNYVVETVKEPLRRGVDILAVGASDDAGLLKGADAAASLIAQYGKPESLTTPLLFRADYGAKQEKMFKPVDFQAELQYARDVHEKGRHQSLAKVLAEIGDRYRASRNPADARLFAAVAKMYADYAANPDPRRYSGIWGQDSDFAAIGVVSGADIVEHDPVLTEQERLDITLLLNSWIYGAVRCKAETQSFKTAHNHGTFGALGSVMAGLYFAKNYPDYPDGEILLRAGDRIFAVQNAAGKVHDDCNSYQWLTWDHVMRYAALRPDDTVLRNGVVRAMGEMFVASMDNDRYQVPFGDTGRWTCFRAEAIPINIAACLTRDPVLEWAANEKYLRWRDEPRLWSSTTLGIFARGDSPALPPPEKFTGLHVLRLSPAFYETEPPENGRPAAEKCFDKISFRQNFDRQSFYMLTDGINGGGHGHADAMSIERLMNFGRQWLADNHYYQGAAVYHNALTVVFGGFWEPYGPYAELLNCGADDKLGVLSMKLAGKSFDWIRHLVWFRDSGSLAVLDAVLPHADGEAVLRQKWNCVGRPDANGNSVDLIQNGAPRMRLESFPDIAPRITPNPELAANWEEYPPAPGEVHCVEMIRSAALRKNELTTIGSLWYGSADGQIASAGLKKLENGGMAFTLGGQQISLHPRGSDRLTIMLDGRGFTADNGKIRTAPPVHAKPAKASAEKGRKSCPQLPGTDSIELKNARCITALDMDEARFAVGTAAGKIILLDDSGKAVREFSAHSPVNALDAGDVNGDGKAEIIAGLEDEAVSAYSADGRELWRYKVPFYRCKGVVNAVKIADLDRDGKKEIIIANNNWRTIAIDGSGRQLWYYETVREGRFVHCADLDGDGREEALVGTRYYHVMALSPDGMVQWRTRTHTPGCLSAATVNNGNRGTSLILGTDGGEIMFFSKGKKTAEYQTGDPVPVLTAGTADGKPVVICGSQNGIMYCCSPDGKTLFWTCNLGSGVTAQLVHDRNIWAGTADGHLYKLAENGRLLAEKQLAGQVLKIAVSGSTIAALTPEGVEIFK